MRARTPRRPAACPTPRMWRHWIRARRRGGSGGSASPSAVTGARVFDAFVTFHAHQHPHRSAVITPSGAMTFAELDAMVTRFARALRDMNLPAGSIVAAGFRNPV